MTNTIALTKSIVPAELFKPFQVQIDEFKDINDKTVFDYEKQNKEARSHVAKLRKTKKPINDVHREAKSEALKLGKDLDAYKKNLISQIDEMIEVHVEPLQRIEDAEKERLEAIAILEEKEKDHSEALEMHDLFKREESMEKQRIEMEETLAELDRIKAHQKREKVRIEREDKIREEAAAQAKLDAENQRLEAEQKLEEEKNRRVREAELAEQKRLDDIQAEKKRADDAKIKAEKEKQDVIDNIKRAQEEKERIEKKRIADEKKEADRLKEIADKKAANKAHRKSVNNKIVKCLMKHKVSEKDAQDIIIDIVNGKVPGLSITY